MVAVARTRTRSLGKGIAGYLVQGKNPPSWTIQSVGSESCNDTIGNPMGDNPLSINRTIIDPLVFDGSNGKTGTARLDAVSLPSIRNTNTISHLSLPPFRDATQAIASGHPGKPKVSIPNFLYELKDVPGMLRQSAERARALHNIWRHRGWEVTHRRLRRYYNKRRFGEDYLLYDFGWRPFFQDLYDILEIDDFLQKRRKKYSKMRGNELRTTGELGSHTTSTTSTGQYYQSVGFMVTGSTKLTTESERWFSARWRVDPIRAGKSLDGDTLSLLRGALGLDTVTPVMIWNALPWSWFADWFANVGSIIQLQGNQQGIAFKSAVIMTRTTTRRVFTIGSKPNWVSCSGGTGERATKQRSIFVPTFLRSDLGENIFTPAHLATLSSLAVTRARGSSRF